MWRFVIIILFLLWRRMWTYNLTMCFIWEDDSFFSSFNRSAAVVDIGIQHANDAILPEELRVRTVYHSSGLSCGKTMYAVVSKVYDMLNSGVKCNAFLGPSCPHTAAALYGFAENLRIPMFGLPAGGAWALQVDSQDADFDLILYPVYGYGDMTDFLLALLDRFKYQHLTIFQDDSYAFFSTVVEPLMRMIRLRNRRLHDNIVVTIVKSLEMDIEQYAPLLRAASDRSRVFILLCHADGIREIMISAHQHGFTNGEHLYIAIELYDLHYWGKINPVQKDAYDTIAADAFSSLLLLGFDDENEEYDHEFAREIKMTARKKYGYLFNPLEPIDPVLAGMYESILMYTSTVTELHTLGGNYTDGYDIVHKIFNSTFNSFQGSQFWMGDDGERDRTFNVEYYNKAAKQFEIFLHYDQHTTEIFHLVHNIRWPSANGLLPPDEPVCGYRGDKCISTGPSSGVLAAVVVVPLLFVFGVSAVAAFVFIKLWKIRSAYNPNWWRIMDEELDIKMDRTGSESRKTLRSVSTGGTHVSSMMVDILAAFNGTLVELTDLSVVMKAPTNDLIEQLNLIKKVDHANCQHVIGISLRSDGICHYLVGELCPKGCLTDILESEMLKLDWFFKNSLIRDVVHGMTYLHTTEIHSHGFLSSQTCLIDSRFTLKVADYGLPFSRRESDLAPPRPAKQVQSLTVYLWRAPELLRQTMPPKGTQKGDVYSFAIILQQIILRSGPFELPSDPLELSEAEIIQEVIAANIPPVRPRVPRASCSNELYDLMERCWEEIPVERPTFPKIKDQLKRIIGNVGDNIVDLLLKRMEQYAVDLEQKVADQTQQFMDEKNRSEQLLSQLLPKSVAAQLTKGVQVDPEAYESVSIFFSDIVGFTTIAARGTPMAVVELLNNLYTFFDSVLEKFDVYKVETIGDAYMVSSGLPVRNGNRHAAEIASMALALMARIVSFQVPHRPQEHIQIRAGANSGPCVAGIVGLKMPRYCLFGDTVNVASRMESTGEAMKIQITEETKFLLDDIGGFFMIERGPVEVKGKGQLITFWLISQH
ncbi:atrial natriuretic peptide receptor 1-like [Paramacrobiotus metropolitanus]|uniref:atrial natriuretic peptide receptor 1-like n=1 Tax=Paramacrobiotus metropolitanus TaxID=2943436 RepID=UPI0024458AA1|nr:atrial natriuretic peptide receptor 1-like [Paramacrobiotus metropolitanus]